MNPGRGAVVTVALCVAAATAGCGLGAGESSSGYATLKITSDYGSQPILSRSEHDPTASETVLRFLDRGAEITTRYGGGFVQSIEGLSGEVADGRSRDWFFFVNGIESSTGAAQVHLNGGDRIWWDYRDWTDVLRAPAVVGSWPEPFAQTSAGSGRLPVEVVCLGARPPCEEAAARLGDAGIDAAVVEEADANAVRLLVGPWARLRTDPAAAQLEGGPVTSGVFARFERDGSEWQLVALDETTDPVGTPEPADAGLVAALRLGEDPATWVATAPGESGVEAAVEALDADALTSRYAVLVRNDGITVGLPEVGG